MEWSARLGGKLKKEKEFAIQFDPGENCLAKAGVFKGKILTLPPHRIL